MDNEVNKLTVENDSEVFSVEIKPDNNVVDYEAKFYDENPFSADVKRVFIEYNTYIPSTKITVEGKEPKDNSDLNVCDLRLQEWIDNLPSILSQEYLSKNFKIGFHGTISDYDDLLEIAQEASKKDINIEIIHYPAKEVKDKENLIKEIFEKIQNSPFDELKDKNGDVAVAFKDFFVSDFEVIIVATMSSGKSTLINSLISKKLMPSKQTSCTAIITKIKDRKSSNSESFTATIHDKHGNEIETCDDLTLKKMQKLNQNPDVSEVYVEGKIPFVSSESISLILTDTPGPNSAKNTSHWEITTNILSKSAKTLVLYVLNAQNLQTTDDDRFLEHVATSMQDNDAKKSRDRFIFVLNKIDTCNMDEDDVDEILKEAKEFLARKGIKNPNIYPASALTALDIRTILSETNGNDVNKFNIDEANVKVNKFNGTEELHLEKYAPLSISKKVEIQDSLKKAEEEKDEKQQALIHSGIISLEEAIKLYVYKYAKPIKIKTIFENFTKKIATCQYFENTKKSIFENKDKEKEILKAISDIEEKLNSGKEAEKFKEKIDNLKIEEEQFTNEYELIMLEKIEPRLTDFTNKGSEKIPKEEFNSFLNDFESASKNIVEQFFVYFKDLVDANIIKYSENILEQYKTKLKDLSSEELSEFKLEPLSMLQDSIANLQLDSLIDEAKSRELISKGEKRDKEWYEWVTKFFRTWDIFSGDFWTMDNIDLNDYVEISKDKYGEFIDKKQFCEKAIGKIRTAILDQFEDICQSTINKVKYIKEYFSEQFEILDNLLKEKLSLLKEKTSNKESIEKTIKELEEKLTWLEKIQKEVDSIIEI